MCTSGEGGEDSRALPTELGLNSSGNILTSVHFSGRNRLRKIQYRRMKNENRTGILGIHKSLERSEKNARVAEGKARDAREEKRTG